MSVIQKCAAEVSQGNVWCHGVQPSAQFASYVSGGFGNKTFNTINNIKQHQVYNCFNIIGVYR